MSLTTSNNTDAPKSGRIKVYVIDPAKYQTSANVPPNPAIPPQPPRITPKPRPTKKRRLSVNVESGEDDPEQESPALKECVTRIGRISKPYISENHDKFLQPPPPPKLRRREPPSMFKCKTCTKVYVGYTKLRNHFVKFPDHESNGSIFRTVTTKKTVAIQATQENEHKVDDVEDLNQPLNIPDLCIPANAHQEPEVDQILNISPITTSLHSSEFLPPNRTWIQFSSFHTNSHSTQQSQPVLVSIPSVSPGTSSSTLTTTAQTTTKSHDISLNISPVKTVWDCVDEKITSAGINSVLLELVDVSEKLSKISRDKIIPIREEEEELGIHSSLPIIRVDSPYLSHLLDLPFGTYVYREDGGTRRPPLPPPSATELSLTSGEVDIDKFLATNSIQSSLPHLTNIDFADM